MFLRQNQDVIFECSCNIPTFYTNRRMSEWLNIIVVCANACYYTDFEPFETFP